MKEEKEKFIKDRDWLNGFLFGFAITTILWCFVFAYIIGKLI